MLYFSEGIIEEIGRNSFQKPDEGYIYDFYKALKQGVNGIPNDNYIKRILLLEKKYNLVYKNIAGTEFNYPPFFTYLLIFMLPFTSNNENDEFNMNNFHGIVKVFFESKDLTTNYNSNIKNNLAEIDNLWNNIIAWLRDKNGFSIGYLEEINPNGNRKYVGKFEYHILFRRKHEERLSTIFDKNDILPGEVISFANMRNLLVENYHTIGLSNTTKNKISDVEDYIGHKIISRALNFYTEWTGVNYVTEGGRGFSRNRLVLCLDFNKISQKIQLKYFRIFTKQNLPNDLRLVNSSGANISNVFQLNQYYSSPINDCFNDLEQDIQLLDNVNRHKYNWKSNEFYIFKRISQFDWVEIPKVEFNVGTTLILCKKKCFENSLNDWFNKVTGNKHLYNNNEKNELPRDWMALSIDSITNYPHSTIPELQASLLLAPRLNFDKSFYHDGVFYADRLPIFWIENIEQIDEMYAKYEDENIPLKQLTTVDNDETKLLNQFIFKEEHFNRNKINKPFKLICGEISSHRFFKINNFSKKSNEEIEIILTKKDLLGLTLSLDENYFKGIENFFTSEIINKKMPFQNQIKHLFINNLDSLKFQENSIYDQSHLGNILLHYISTKGQITKNEFNEIIFSLLKDHQITAENVKQKSFRLSHQLQENGYVDYDSTKSTFTVNKPHLIVIPTDSGAKFNLIGARDQNFINSIFDYCSQSGSIKIEILSDENNHLYPQTIYLHTNKANHEIINLLANEFKIIFMKNGMFTQFALTSCFPDIKDLTDNISITPENEITDLEGGKIFDINNLQFIDKPNDFDRDLSFIKFENINGYKTIYKLWYENNCYNIPDQQIGIYSYLYLYTQLRKNNLDKKQNDFGWINSREEIDALEKAQKMANIFIYDKDKYLFAIPLSCKLPKFFTISLKFMSEISPTITTLHFEDLNINRKYIIYKNINKNFITNQILNKLCKRDLIYQCTYKTISL
jgi:hypothetical protein